ncbi:MAG: type II secretion system protein, partial [Pseudomonadota bacterium]
TALRRIAYEIRTAVPNSLRISANSLEFIPTIDGGRYRRSGTGNALTSSTSDASFDVLSPPVTGSSGDFVVINNTGIGSQNAYLGDNRRTLNASAGNTL